MFPPWRFKLREAQVALEQGRLEEAAHIAGQPEVRTYLPVQQLVVQIGEQLARRALERAAAGDFAGAWRDLDEARQIAGETADWQRLSQAVAEVAALASELLEISPENRVARDARKRAWDKVGAPVGDSRRLAETQHWGGAPSAGVAKGVAVADVETKRAARFMLWIDAVGGYLV